MANTFKYSQFEKGGGYNREKKKGSPFENVPKGYYGRSGRDEYFYRPELSDEFERNRIASNFDYMRGGYNPKFFKNRNYSALNYAPIDDKSYSAIYGHSSDPKKRNLPSLLNQPSNRQKPIGIANDGVKQTGTGTGNTPPNQKNNLLNYLVSPKGRGMAQGLLEASGYSDVPITAGQALAMGLKRSNESQAAADASVAAQQKAYMDNLLVQSQIYKNYQPSGNPQHSFRPMTAEEKKAYGIPEDVPARFNETLNKPEIMSTGGGTKLDVNIDQSTDKGTESWFKSRGDAFSKTVDTLSSGADAADIDNQSLARFVQLSELAKTGKTAELLADMQGWADSLGVDLSGLDLANMGATQALNSVAGRFVMQQVQKTKGAVSDREMAYFMKISANIGNSPLGNQLIVNMAQSMNGRVIEENNLLNNYLDEMYEKDPNMSAYALERGWKKIQQKFRDENQLFQGDIKDEIKAYYDDNDIKYTDSTKVIEDTLKDYPNAEYMGVDEDDKLQFKIYKDGKYQYFSVGA